MTTTQQLITVGVLALATVVTRFLPFIIFSEKRKPPKYIEYMGKVLPPAVFGLLIVYCLKDVSVFKGTHGIPEAVAIAITVAVHKWKHKLLLSILAGTISYMLLLYLFNSTAIFTQ